MQMDCQADIADLSNQAQPPAKATVIRYDVSNVGQSGTRTFSDPAADPGSLPSAYGLREAVSALQGSRERRQSLMRERGIAPATARRYGIGWSVGRQAWLLPVRDSAGKLVNVTYRPPRDGGMWGPAGWVTHPVRIGGRTAANGGLPLYPSIPERLTWLLGAGEWDVLAARQAGIEQAVTGLCGCQWNDAWNSYAIGKRVAVCYDVGEEHAAARTVERLLAAGASEAWTVTLPLPEPGDDLEKWFRKRIYGGYGRTGEQLVQLIRKARP